MNTWIEVESRSRAIDRKKLHRKRIERTRRKLFGIFFVIIIFTALFSSISGFSKSDEVYVPYSVKSGDTLWAIAREYKPQDMTTEEFVYKIKKANSMTKSNINVGVVLNIPT